MSAEVEAVAVERTARATGSGGRVRTGLDRLLERPERLAGRRYGLLAHAAAVTADLRPVHLALAAGPAGPPAAVFAPEHGFYAVEQDMVPAAGDREPWTGAALLSLYGDSADSLRPDPGAFRDLDLLLIDLQDVGSRYYTFAATAVWAAEAALAAGCEVWVLDRPNPLGGERVEGDLPLPGHESFVGAFRLPVRHGLTLGELMRLEARRRGWSREPPVWTMEGWRRRMSWEETGLPWIAPSPNMPTAATARLYPGACLVEATELSEGRGTTRPFQLVGAPGLDPLALVRELGAAGPGAAGLPGVRFLPTYFRPQFHKHAGVVCGGVELVVTDAAVFRPYRTGLELLAAVVRAAPDLFAWRREAYEFVADRPAIDLLTGNPAYRLALEAGGEGLEELAAGWGEAEAAFRRERREVLLYPEEGTEEAAAGEVSR